MRTIVITDEQAEYILQMSASSAHETDKLAKGCRRCSISSRKHGDIVKAEKFLQSSRKYSAEARMWNDLFDRVSTATRQPVFSDDFSSDCSCVEDDPFTSSSYVPF